MSTPRPGDATFMDATKALAPLISAASDEIEAMRGLPASLVRAMAEAGLFRMLVPRALGGGQTDPFTMFAVIEELSRLDGAVGWCVAIGAGTAAFVAPYLREEVATEIFLGNPNVVIVGTLNPRGRATPVDGGYRVTGRWAFGSGCRHADWLASGCLVYDGDEPRRRADGTPDARLVIVPAASCEIIDTWTVAGLRGTGSHDYAIADLFVSEAWTLSHASDQPRYPGPHYAAFWLLIAHAAHGLGVARRAIDALVELAGTKTPARSQALLRDRASVQSQVAQAEALVGAARAYILATVDDAWTAASGGEVTLEQRARIRLANTYAVQSAARAVDLMYDAGGGTSIYASFPVERCFRDIHTATQHAVVATTSYEVLGKRLLGLDLPPSLRLL